jgi:hypothetical protein
MIRDRSDRGASMIFAVALLLVMAGVVASLSIWLTNDTGSGGNLLRLRTAQSEYTDAASLAIQTLRYTPQIGYGQTLNASPPVECAISSGATAWCSTNWNPTSTATRTVTIDVCSSVTSVSSCAASPNLLAVVVFNDYPPGSIPQTSECTDTCGYGETIQMWSWFGMSPLYQPLNAVNDLSATVYNTDGVMLSWTPPTPDGNSSTVTYFIRACDLTSGSPCAYSQPQSGGNPAQVPWGPWTLGDTFQFSVVGTTGGASTFDQAAAQGNAVANVNIQMPVS